MLFKNTFFFLPLFVIFFKKFNYFPFSIKYKNFKYFDENNFKYFLNVFSRNGSHKKIFSFFSRFINFFNINFIETSTLNFHNSIIILYKNYINNFFSKFNYIFLFFFSKLNKKLLKYSNYKRKRFSLHLLYIPSYRRSKTLIKFSEKNLIYINKKTFFLRFQNFLESFFLNPSELFFYKYTIFIQNFILKKKKYTLFLKS